MDNQKPTVGVAFMTHCSKKHLKHCLPPVLSSSVNPKVLVVNSSSNDGTVEEAERLGADTLVVPRRTFNHGLTREIARKELNTDIVVMMTPDAYSACDDLIETVTRPLREGNAEISYARQIPHEGAKEMETFPRLFNYPAESHIRTIEDVARFGSYLFFCSDNCCAYQNSLLDELGGFPMVLTAEDALICAQALKKGYRVAYTAEAVIRHSHDQNLIDEFRRNYDIGYMRKEFEEVLKGPPSDEKRGLAFAKELFSYLKENNPKLIPYAFLILASRYAGYRLGRLAKYMPDAISKLISSQDYYWTSEPYFSKRNQGTKADVVSM